MKYTCSVSTDNSNWEEVFNYSTGIITFNMPVVDYSVSNGYFERVFPLHNSSFCQENASAPVSHVYIIEKMPMDDGSFTRVVAAPSIRLLHSPIGDQDYAKFYMPQLTNGTNLMLSQSVTLTGKNIYHESQSGINYVKIEMAFPKADQGFDSAFFNFDSNEITIQLLGNPVVGSVVEFYVGEVMVSIGLNA